ncbi:uncharacterized protein LOC128127026 [Lactuca sativa]|uniref:uncharacterized protein LOC128127026 n=1 Tax=Lactuca sativa TaxID=4236 RepID=UPI0022AFDC87|nr:uncharacterized protein LOC128127026 [Lactuca sativa]
MEPFDPFHPYNHDIDEDDMFVGMMYQYVTDMIPSEPAPLLTRRAALNRDREEGHRRLVHDYFADNCVYQPNDFKRRFRLRKNKIIKKLFDVNVLGRSPTELMALGESPDSIDDYMRMSERTARESLYRLARGVIKTFGDKYFSKPSLNEIQQLYTAHEERHGFRECLEALIAQSGYREIVLWRRKVNTQVDLLTGKAQDAPFTINGHVYKFGYYLTDGIYPTYSTFVKAFRHPIEPRDKFFKRRQERARKDVEHKGRNIAEYSPMEPGHIQFQSMTAEYLHRVVDIQDQRKHKQLREDLADHIYDGSEVE